MSAVYTYIRNSSRAILALICKLNKWISLALIYSSSCDFFDQWETSVQGSATGSQLVAEEGKPVSFILTIIELLKNS